MLRLEKKPSWFIFPWMSVKCPSPSPLINSGLNYILLDIRIGILACFLCPFFGNLFTTLYSEEMSTIDLKSVPLCSRKMDPVLESICECDYF